MYRWESWSMKKAEHQRTDAFELWCWRRLLRVLWIARSKQGILKWSTLTIYWKDWCWSWSSNTLATWWEEPTHWTRPWLWERLKVGGEGDDRWDGWMASLTQWTWVWANSRRWWRMKTWHAVVHGVTKSWRWLSNWTTTGFSDRLMLSNIRLMRESGDDWCH